MNIFKILGYFGVLIMIGAGVLMSYGTRYENSFYLGIGIYTELIAILPTLICLSIAMVSDDNPHERGECFMGKIRETIKDGLTSCGIAVFEVCAVVFLITIGIASSFKTDPRREKYYDYYDD